MRLINITTRHTNEDIDDILYTLSESEIHKIKIIYDKIRFVEYVKDNFNCMFCIVNDYDIEDLSKLYDTLSVKFKMEDLTKKVILCDDINTSYLSERGFDVSKEINNLIKDSVSLARRFTDDVEWSPEDGTRTTPDFLCKQ